MPSSDIVIAFFDGLTLHKVNILAEYLRQFIPHFAQFNWFGYVFLLKTDQHADSAVGAEILVQNRAKKTKVANMMLLTKRIYLVFRYRYMTVHIFTAFSKQYIRIAAK
jgi:hypothetical protein